MLSKKEQEAAERMSIGFALVIMRELVASQVLPDITLCALADAFAKSLVAIESYSGKQDMVEVFDKFEKNVRILYCQYREIKKKMDGNER